MDFMEGLPPSSSFNVLRVVADKFSKFSHFVPLKHPFTAATVAKLFIDQVYHLRGMPKVIISDRDRIFTRKLWQLLFKSAGSKLRFSCSYHPQTDGQTERVNQCIETFFCCFVHTCPSSWSHWISVAEYWVNTSTHSALGWSPFEVLYGFPPRHLGYDLADAALVP